MRLKKYKVLVGALLLCLVYYPRVSASVPAPAPPCIAKYSVAIFEALGEDKQATATVFQIVKGFSGDAQKGVVAFLGSATLDGQELSVAFEHFAGFRGAPVLDHPLQTGDALFSAIGQISHDVDAIPGFPETLAKLGAEVNTNDALGAAMDIAVAKDFSANNTLLSFQQNLSVGGIQRNYDVAATCSSCSGGILYNEDKNWTFALSADANGRINDFRFPSFLNEFERDIILQSSSGFSAYQVNLRTFVQGQQSAIVDSMLEVFDNPSARLSANLSPLQIAQARASFLARVQSGTFFTYR